MQDHLCQILAHYVLYLGSQLGIQIAGHVEQFILEAAAARWKKQGNFEWLTTPRGELEPRESLDICADLPTNCLDSFSDPYLGNPSVSHETVCQPLFDSLPAMGSPESTSRISTGQNPHSRPPFGGAEDPNVVQHNPPRLENYQPISAALESFHHWNSKWYTYPDNMEFAAQHNGPISIHSNSIGFVARASWGGMYFSLTVAR